MPQYFSYKQCVLLKEVHAVYRTQASNRECLQKKELGKLEDLPGVPIKNTLILKSIKFFYRKE
jgi:hypothetical protein